MYKEIQKYSLVAQSYPTLCNSLQCSMPGFPVCHQHLELAQTHVHRVGDAIQPSHPLLSPYPPAFNISEHQCLFKWVSLSWSIKVSASASVPFNEYLGLISFKIDWFDFLAVQGVFSTQESSPTPQFKSISSLALNFLYGPTLTPYMTTGKTTSLTRRAFVSTAMSLLFNILSSLV